MGTQLANNTVYDANGRLIPQQLVNVDDPINPTFSSLQVTSLTASTALVSDSTMHVISSTCTSTELSYVHGVTSAIQTQLDGKQASLGFTAVPNTRTVNGHALSSNVTVTASDVSALALTGGTLTGDLNISHAATDSVLTIGSGTGAAQIIGDTSSDLKFQMNKAGAVLALLPSTSGNATWLQSNGSITVNDTTNVPSAVLVATDTTRGFLPPRLTTTQQNAISSPAAGLMIYNTTLAAPAVYNSAWNAVPLDMTKVSLTNQSADIGTTALFTAPATGLYMINSYAVTTATDAGAGNNVVGNFIYTDDSGSRTFPNIVGGIDLTTAGSVAPASFTAEVVSGQTLSYNLTGGGTYGTARYSLYIVVTRLC